MDFQRFYDKYLNLSEKERDPYNVSIDLLPFITNVSTSKFDGTCGLKGITGEFFRDLRGTDTSISDYVRDAEAKVERELNKMEVPIYTIERFKDIMKDLMATDNQFVPIEASFLQYYSLDVKESGKVTKYGAGQRRIATYLSSMILDKGEYNGITTPSNLLSQIIKTALDSAEQPAKEKKDSYYILPFVRRQFEEDLKWFLSKDDYVIIKHIDLFLYFYVCYSVAQTIMSLDACNMVEKDLERPELCYFVLADEPASEKRCAVTQGWSSRFKSRYIEKMYGRMQAVDILNTIAKSYEEEVVGLYPDLLKRFSIVPFDETKQMCSDVLEYYNREKSQILKKRDSETNRGHIGEAFDCTVSSYEEFFKKLESLCMKLQSQTYQSKFSSQIIDLFKIRLLQQRRGRGQAVLVLDEEMLPFLIALFTRERRTKLKDLYGKFAEYGIYFDMKTKEALAQQLQKMNVLERKSDSGEAQYATVIL